MRNSSCDESVAARRGDAPIGLCIIGVGLIDATYRAFGIAPVPFLITGYALGAGAGDPAPLVLPRFAFAITALTIGALGALTGSNILAWLVGVPSVGGVAMAMPLDARTSEFV